ncbi:MAG: Holliday junction branch migration protein RuvA [Candidatus Gastranaerophilales bacterium]|nr:Holliday junction branch migration protein RuvA [Candidatus Gastranaerophilales bacterium]
MYDYIKGLLISKQTQSYRGSNAVVEANGVGYLLLVTPQTIQKLPDIDSNVKIFISLIHREDSMSLCGFLTKEERDIFNILQSVSGVGVKLSLLLLDEFPVSELINVVVKSDYKELSRAKGVGPKLAQKIILELKDKLINWSNVTPVPVDDVSENTNLSADCISEAQSVLLSLGYTINEAKAAIKAVVSSIKMPKDSEEVLRYALEFLAQQ